MTPTYEELAAQVERMREALHKIKSNINMSGNGWCCDGEIFHSADCVFKAGDITPSTCLNELVDKARGEGAITAERVYKAGVELAASLGEVSPDSKAGRFMSALALYEIKVNKLRTQDNDSKGGK